ncbi:glutamate--cysteine ligase regulatory subunit-like [Amphibalanus amphitrite]|uniref:glutamate--cysteine ligase regulatory subunit-like n=1 Tax=Amphibalanus amphitrite TaxID=1232801 RepID=UPI001C90691F|nr:glutamate--cysteine ligase regulatory subunit-like [Amphibalanus amphitrite]XP_043188373.1 glutamate--cysteine ligase regulatory subunit-like [Amphibalanus amphitrite]XP_043188374.1 glutamate--cysteine ligase regulatory subunit-like [Amphibalanus amphitrite]XP_043188375.1 glutamate--cysteine ligase regulatory subunit-like [Amphibalanus amphitrite]
MSGAGESACSSRGEPLALGEACTDLTMSTGNVISMRGVRRRAGQGTTEELMSSLDHMLDIIRPAKGELDRPSVVMAVPCACYSVSLGEEEREPLSITVKLFPVGLDTDAVRQAVERALTELSVKQVEAIVLSNPLPWEEMTLEQLLPLWRVLEQFHAQQKVAYLGLADVEQSLFEAICQCDQVEVKPSLLQINLTNCCSVPDDLRDFCRQRDVQILTHNDAQEVLPGAVLRPLLSKHLALAEPQRWSLVWSLRYLVMVQHKGVIKNKGYIVHVTRS